MNLEKSTLMYAQNFMYYNSLFYLKKVYFYYKKLKRSLLMLLQPE